MIDEFNVLLKNETWSLVPYQSHMNVLGYKWVLHTKRKPNGSVDCYKDRLVAKGFHQILGVHYADTFSHVFKMPTIRIILSLACNHSWPL